MKYQLVVILLIKTIINSGKFPNENPWIIHGPKNYERITIRGETMAKAVKIAEKLKNFKDKISSSIFIIH